MGQLKPSEVRLLILFCATVLVLGTFFLYEWYSRAVVDVNSEKIRLEGERQSFIAMKSEQNEYNMKRVWLNENQPIAQDEFEAKEALDRVVSVRGIDAAGLTLVSSPPEKDPSLEAHYWAFERRVVVEGDIQGIVKWLSTLQSESEFRAITQLHIFPKKKKEPEVLTCEVAIEQRYATEEIVNRTNVVILPPLGQTPPSPEASPEGNGDTPPAPGAASEAASAAGDSPPAATRRVVTPTGATPGGTQGGKPEVTRPRVRLPEPAKRSVNPPGTPASSSASGDEQAQSGSNGGVGRGLLANAKRTRASRAPAPPPPMQADIAQAEAEAMARGVEPSPVITGAVPPEEIGVGTEVSPTSQALPEPKVIKVFPEGPTDEPQPPSAPTTISVNGVVGEAWDANTPGANPNGEVLETEQVGDGPTNEGF